MDTHPNTSSNRGRIILIATLVISLLAVIVIQSVAQGDDSGSATPDFIASNGERVFLNDDGSYRIALPGQGTSREFPAPSGPALAGAGFGQRSDAPSGDSIESPNVHIVNFVTSPLASYREEIQLLGGLDGKYIPDSSMLVLMDPTVVANVAALPYVRSVTPYTSEYRATADTYPVIGSADFRNYAIALFDDTEASRLPVLDLINALEGQVRSSNLGSGTILATVRGTALPALLTHDRVQFVELLAEPEVDTERERLVSGADLIELDGGYNGSGVSINVYDNGIRETHEQFNGQNIIVVSDDPVDSHGTSTTSVIAGNGATRPETRGIAPESTIFFTSYNVSNDRIANAQAMTDPAGPYRAVVSVSPWGTGFLPGSTSPDNSGYTAVSEELDSAAFQYDLLTVQSMGNFSTNQYRPQASAKNVISVGAIGHLQDLDPSNDTWSPPRLSAFAGTGPIADGRIKPDLHFWNDATPAALHGPTDGDSSYYAEGFAGTSAATAVTGGYVGLMYEMWADGVFAGTPGLNRDVFDARPGMATAKALTINTAAEYGFNSVASDKNRFQQGWGRPDVGYARDLALAGNIPILIDETDLLTPFSSNSYTFDVVSGGRCAMRTTMVYTDPAGTPGSFVHRINDLSLRLTSPSGLQYWGNNGLTSGNESVPGGTSNKIDTVENVFLTNPEVGTWTIEVFGDEIVEDSHVETSALDADYALVASGDCLGDTPPPTGGVTGSIWSDDNADGVNGRETGLAEVQVTILNANGSIATTTATNAQGLYSFADLTPGSYTVTVDTASPALADTSATFDSDGTATPNTVAVTVSSSVTATADFGYQVQLVSVGNRVFIDADFSGSVTAGDTGPPSPITVQLLDAAGTLAGTTTTDADGFWAFDRIAPGEYRIAIPLSETQQGQGGAADTFDSTVGAPSPGRNVDLDDNGFMASGSGIRTELFELSVDGEPTGDSRGNATVTVPDSNANMTIDIGLFPARD